MKIKDSATLNTKISFDNFDNLAVGDVFKVSYPFAIVKKDFSTFVNDKTEHFEERSRLCIKTSSISYICQELSPDTAWVSYTWDNTSFPYGYVLKKLEAEIVIKDT